MDTLAGLISLIHLIPNKYFSRLFDPRNQDRVYRFCLSLDDKPTPTTMIINGQDYEIVTYQRKRQKEIVGEGRQAKALVSWARKNGVFLGYEDLQQIELYQNQIPSKLCQHRLVFPGTLDHNHGYNVLCLMWRNGYWKDCKTPLEAFFDDRFNSHHTWCFLRRLQ